MQIGQKAPGFGLYDTAKKKIHLSDFRGNNVVILFFPLAFTSVCTKELCSVSDSMESFDNFNAQVLGISVDSLYTLSRYREIYKIGFPLLSDFNKEVSTAYNTIYETFSYEMKGVSKRSVFLINRDGMISYFEILENASHLPDFEKVRQQLQNLESVG